MALTQQFARVTPEYLDRCRATALDSAGASPGWDPPEADRLDTDWALWGLLQHCRSTGADPELIALLDRALSGDPDGDVGFLDHDEVHDGFGDPPRLLGPRAVAVIAAALDRVQLDNPLVVVARIHGGRGHRLRIQGRVRRGRAGTSGRTLRRPAGVLPDRRSPDAVRRHVGRLSVTPAPVPRFTAPVTNPIRSE